MNTLSRTEIEQVIRELLHKYHAEYALLFGSYARGEATAASDIDVIVVGGGGAGMAAATRLAQLGKSVILVEKSGFLGGAISVSGGNQVVMGFWGGAAPAHPEGRGCL